MQVAKNFRIVVLLMGATPLFAQSQQNQQQTPPPAQSSQSAPSAPATKKPSTADDNPFPEDISRKAAADDNAAPSAPPTSTPDSAKPPGSTAPPGSSTPPRSTSPEDSNSSSRSKFQGLGDLPDDNSSRISNGAGGYIVNPKLAAQDVKVGGFYLDQRDYKGAYARFKEATLVDAGNADAVFGLAEAARGLNHKDEAVQNYQLYLDASPDGKKAKEARKALASMSESQAPKK